MGLIVRQNNIIKGILIEKEFVCLLQYADYTLLFRGNRKSLKSALHLLFKFSKSSGLKPNINKTEAVWISSDEPVCDNTDLP